MSQSVSLTKFTTHLSERHSWRHSRWVHIISALWTFWEHFMSVGVLSSTQGMWHNKGRKYSVPAQPDEILSVLPLLLPALPALVECLQCVPDESPRAAWTEGRKRLPRSARSRGLSGRKGTSDVHCTSCFQCSFMNILSACLRYWTQIHYGFLFQTGRSWGQRPDG